MKYLCNPSTDPHWNMAFDQFTLERLSVDEPLFYLWRNAPAVIIGLNQSAYAEVDLPYLEAQGIVLARRVTGGGAVYHDLQNLNYSIVGPIRQMEDAVFMMEKALRELGVPVERTGRNDLKVDGRKCSGYAKRMSRDRLMVHGTLMWDVNLERLTRALSVPGSKLEAAGIESVRSRVANLKEYLPGITSIEAFQDKLQTILAQGDTEYPLSPEQRQEVDRMADEKFRLWEWNFGHSPATTFASRKHFPCGTVEARYTLKHGVFTALQFTGDFIGARPAADLAARLIGQRPEAVLSLETSAFFDGVSPEEILALFLS